MNEPTRHYHKGNRAHIVDSRQRSYNLIDFYRGTRVNRKRYRQANARHARTIGQHLLADFIVGQVHSGIGLEWH